MTGRKIHTAKIALYAVMALCFAIAFSGCYDISNLSVSNVTSTEADIAVQIIPLDPDEDFLDPSSDEDLLKKVGVFYTTDYAAIAGGVFGIPEAGFYFDGDTTIPTSVSKFERDENKTSGDYKAAGATDKLDVTVHVTGLEPGTKYYMRPFIYGRMANDSSDTYQFTKVIEVTTPYQITATAGEGGSISPAGDTSVAAGESQVYTITPNDGYEIASLKVDGADVAVASSYTFSDVAANHTIEATFKSTKPAADSSSAKPNAVKSVKTGDSSDIAYYGIALVACILALAGIIYRRKHN